MLNITTTVILEIIILVMFWGYVYLTTKKKITIFIGLLTVMADIVYLFAVR